LLEDASFKVDSNYDGHFMLREMSYIRRSVRLLRAFCISLLR